MPEDYHSAIANSSTHTLQHYIDNSEKYFISHVQLHFLPGQHHLNIDLDLKGISNFTITGLNFTIICTSPASITAVNVTDLKLQNIILVNCGKNKSMYFNSTYFSSNYKNDPKLLNKIGFNASTLLYYCSYVTINKINITVKAGITGILSVNIKKYYVLRYVNIKILSALCSTFQAQLTGILFYHNDWKIEGTINILIIIEHFYYEMNKTCSNFLQYTITILLFKSQYQVVIRIQKTIFRNLNNSSVLFFYGERSTNYKPQIKYKNTISINNCIISNNSVKYYFKMFYIVHSNTLIPFNIFFPKRLYSQLLFKNCIFENNSNMAAMIFVIPAHSTTLTTIITIFN